MQIIAPIINKIMVIPIMFLVAIPIFLGIVTVSPFDIPEPREELISEEPNVNILYFFLMGIWLFF